jgi:hypothetical protein
MAVLQGLDVDIITGGFVVVGGGGWTTKRLHVIFLT